MNLYGIPINIFEIYGSFLSLYTRQLVRKDDYTMSLYQASGNLAWTIYGFTTGGIVMGLFNFAFGIMSVENYFHLKRLRSLPEVLLIPKTIKDGHEIVQNGKTYIIRIQDER